MNPGTSSPETMTRRESLTLIAAVGAAYLVGCGPTGDGTNTQDGGSPTPSGGSPSPTPGADPTTIATSTPAQTTDPGDATSPGDSTQTTEAPTAAGSWATGGTASMSGDYPDPFTTAATTCSQTCEMTEGPCTAASVVRRDISEGVNGLPVRLSLKIVDVNCDPVEGASVDVWHCAPNGLYSGSDASDMCTDNNPEAEAARWFRGTQTTDAAGRVDFDTCFPGWYSSRAVHIHVQVSVAGSRYNVSQIFFPQETIEDVFSTHPVYSGYGQPDTSNDEDSILGDNDEAMFIAQTERMGDGAMLAWHSLVIRSTLSDASCTASQSNGEGGGPGGPPAARSRRNLWRW